MRYDVGTYNREKERDKKREREREVEIKKKERKKERRTRAATCGRVSVCILHTADALTGAHHSTGGREKNGVVTSTRELHLLAYLLGTNFNAPSNAVRSAVEASSTINVNYSAWSSGDFISSVMHLSVILGSNSHAVTLCDLIGSTDRISRRDENAPLDVAFRTSIPRPTGDICFPRMSLLPVSVCAHVGFPGNGLRDIRGSIQAYGATYQGQFITGNLFPVVAPSHLVLLEGIVDEVTFLYGGRCVYAELDAMCK